MLTILSCFYWLITGFMETDEVLLPLLFCEILHFVGDAVKMKEIMHERFAPKVVTSTSKANSSESV